ncbi:AAA family ATPase [Methylobacterium sp. J-078]|uniref:bifunctional aminoglycoside phosphotransferase/ATP-binding protein n=1 Tax=Methylobacterium sp. J-078 TaxID=2836657 RepID=UPI001FBB46C5|nr:bifunctional aminoglycoside phosphotransferase/ATP-binding protein [Methylobacterium sp. J-078]MCJ2045279.1 AAA family ATPase [Methylobacterium sp. J-078]
MTVEDQVEAVAFLKAEAAVLGLPVDTITTHISTVLMAGDRAFKLKRPVRFPYLDFSTAERRLSFCEAELVLNRRTAPALYLGVRRITQETDGRLAFDGAGPLVDAVVEMRRFAQHDLLDDMAQRDALTPTLITDLAHRIAQFHRGAAVSLDHGGAAGIAAVLDMNDRSLRAVAFVPEEAADAIRAAFRSAFERHAPMLEKRRLAGKVRRCHGDLILRNICLVDDVPTLFDCIEFDDAIATIDVLYDLAFLLMDLWHRDQGGLANLLFNRYLDETDEAAGIGALPFLMAIRAAIRAHVTAAQAGGQPPGKAARTLVEARAYHDLALSLLAGSDATLLAIGGLSGSGKSTVAACVASHLGPPPGARVLNSDRIRKDAFGVSANTRLPPSAYLPEVSATVYASLRDEAFQALSSGCAVVADAVFDRPSERSSIEVTAAKAGVSFRGVWLEAPNTGLLASRIADRRNDPSDATAEVLMDQVRHDCGDIDWQHLAAEADPTTTRDAILASSPSRGNGRIGSREIEPA